MPWPISNALVGFEFVVLDVPLVSNARARAGAGAAAHSSAAGPCGGADVEGPGRHAWRAAMAVMAPRARLKGTRGRAEAVLVGVATAAMAPRARLKGTRGCAGGGGPGGAVRRTMRQERAAEAHHLLKRRLGCVAPRPALELRRRLRGGGGGAEVG